jgi:hypothetical protein
MTSPTPSATTPNRTLDDMSRLQRDPRFQAASFLVLSGAGFFLLFQDDERARLVGVIALLMFGGGGLALGAGQLLSKRPGPMRRGPIELPSGEVVRGLIVPMRTGQLLGGYVATAFVLVASILMVVFPQVFGGAGDVMRWVMAGVAILLIFVLAVAIPRFRGPEPILALTGKGLLSRRYDGTVFYPWDVIRSVEVQHYRGQIALAVDLNSQKGIERTGGTRFFSWLDRPILGFDAGIPLVGSAHPPDEIAALIQGYVDEPATRQELDEA